MQNLSGKKYGSLNVQNEYRRDRTKHGTKIFWRCLCDCGAEFYIDTTTLKKRRVKYCAECRPVGVRNEKLYHVYHGMIQRCYNSKNPSYKKYGGKGVGVCSEWLRSYEVFKRWAIDSGYKDGLTIDRENSIAGYNPENCRWISLSENSARANIGAHKNKTRLIDPFAIDPAGDVFEIQNISDFAREHGLSRSSVSAALHGRINNEYRGWVFHSNKTRSNQESVTTIESTLTKKDCECGSK